jgi:hypothetical protein
MNTRISAAVLTASFLFMGLRGRAIAQTVGLSAGQPFVNPKLIPASSGRAVTNPPAISVGTAPSAANAGRFVSFDPPRSQSTLPTSINVLGDITGYYFDANSTIHAFLRSVNGTIATFDGPGAGAPLAHSGTFPAAINDFGSITGSYYDANQQQHGFVRLNDCAIDHPKNCTFLSFDVPAAVNGTNPTGINLEGAITGYYYDANYGVHGFQRAPNGAFTTVYVPGAGGASGLGTAPTGINLVGVIVGNFSYPSLPQGAVKPNFGPPPVFGGFLRNPDGKITTLAPPNATSIGFQLAINLTGVITGNYVAANSEGGVSRGFVRSPNGTFAIFDAAPCCISTYPTSVNDFSVVTGSYNDEFLISHGFVRTSYGVITSFDPPGAEQGTFPVAINLDGAITGSYMDANSVSHGFLRLNN